MNVKLESEEQDDRDSKRLKLQTSTSGENDLSERIVKQLEYYFSDVNIWRDKFLLEEFKKQDGWVNLSLMTKFCRLKELTDDPDRLVQALSDHKSEVIEFDLETKQIRRKNPVPDIKDYKINLDKRTVHISGFPTDYKFDALRQFCGQFGEVESVAMRRHFKTRFFKGCVHVVYKNQADAEKVLSQTVLKCKDRELRKESMDEYHNRKTEMQKKRLEGRKNKGLKIKKEADDE